VIVARQSHEQEPEMETLNGFTIIARNEEKRAPFTNATLILAARKDAQGEYEYVTAWHRRGERQWDHGMYFRNLFAAVENYGERE
jgi:hypothetical protein